MSSSRSRTRRRRSRPRYAGSTAAGLWLMAMYPASPALAQADPALIRAQCETVHEIEDQSILYGAVVDGRSGLPLPGSTVFLSWVTLGGASDSTLHEAAADTQDGTYIFCDVPQDIRLLAWADAFGLRSDRAELYFEGGESTRENLTIRLRSAVGVVSGILLDATTEQPIEAATVSLPSADASTLTDSDGRFRLADIPLGAHDAEIGHVAYGQPLVTVRVLAGVSTYLTIRLEPRAIAVAPISVEIRMRPAWLESNGFYDRQVSGLGQFVTPEQLRAQPWRRFSEILRDVPGVDLRQVCTPHCSVILRMAGATQTQCVPTFYMNGARVNPMVDDRGAIDLGMLSVGSDLAALEVYRGISQTPAQFYGRCGSVVIWTRRGAG